MRLLVTGAAGFIGSHCLEAGLKRGFEVVGLDNFDPFYPPEFKEANLEAAGLGDGTFQLIRGDIRDRAVWPSLTKGGEIDAVIHLAARSDVRQSIDDAAEYVSINVDGTLNMLEFCRVNGIRKFLFASSCVVYGLHATVPFREEDPAVEPVSPYAASKRSGELLCHAYCHLHGIHATCLRFFSVYGPRQRPNMAIHKFARLLRAGEEIPVYGEGKMVRDYACVTDIVEGVFLALEHVRGFHIYNLGHSNPHSTLELVEAIERAFGISARIGLRRSLPGDVRVSFASIDLARRELGYQPRIGLDQGLEQFAVWFENHGEQIHLALESVTGS